MADTCSQPQHACGLPSPGCRDRSARSDSLRSGCTGYGAGPGKFYEGAQIIEQGNLLKVIQ